VDDDVDITRLMARLLGVLGQNVQVANSAEQAIALGREFKPQMVLCDIGLAGVMTGHDVVRTLRASSDFADTTMIAVTGYSEAEDRQASRKAGFDLHLTKPVTMQKLIKILDERG